MSARRIGIIGGLSWHSTVSYYEDLHLLAQGKVNPWSQPKVIVDSVDFGLIAPLLQKGDFDATAEILIDSAKRLEAAGATVLAIASNTMHVNFDQVRESCSLPVVDVRASLVNEAKAKGLETIAVLGTKYLLEENYYVEGLKNLGLNVVLPDKNQADTLQRIIFEELTVGMIKPQSRDALIEISNSLLDRGADVIGLCCTEFGLLVSENETFPTIDSTKAHVRDLLRLTGN